MTPLRQRFIDDMRLRNYAQGTIDAYVAGVARFASHFGRSPDQLGPEELREYQLEMLRRRLSWSTFNQTVSGLRLFYRVTLGRPEQVPFIPFGKRPRTLPGVLSPDEVVRLLDAVKPGRDRVLFQTAYACGLRLHELTQLRVDAVDGARRVVIVRQGKGRKDRLVPLSARLLELLRAYWLERRPRVWLFPGQRTGRPLSDALVQRLCQKAVRRAGLAKPATMHTLRHCFATHMLEAGVDLLALQAMMGHASLQTTMRYLHVSGRRWLRVPSLLDRLMLPAPEAAAPSEGLP
jgi:site-specific recombinase XerD